MFILGIRMEMEYKGPTGYLGYSYLETPGNPIDGVDNDEDGILDEKRDSGPGMR